MAKTAGKRLPLGATTAMVIDALWRLHKLPSGQLVSVSRVALLNELQLPETTIDDAFTRAGEEQACTERGAWAIHAKPAGEFGHSRRQKWSAKGST